MNFSKRGIGVSTGVKGFRVSSGPRGTHVTIGAHGLYYRAKLGGKGARSSYRAPPNPSAPPPGYATNQGPMNAVSGADVSRLVPLSAVDALERLNETAGKPRAFGWVLLIAAVTTFSSMFAGMPIFCGAAVLWAIAMPLIASLDIKARTYPVTFEFDGAGRQRWAELRAMFTELGKAQAIWCVNASAFGDPKYNAGASTIINRAKGLFLLGMPTQIETSEPVPVLRFSAIELSFLPDQLYVRFGGHFGACDYAQIRISASHVQFVESGGVPSDSRVVGHSWQHPNRDGSPDRRFSYNPQIPIALYGELCIEVPGLSIVLQISRADLAEWLANQFVIWQRAGQSRTKAPPQSHAKPSAPVPSRVDVLSKRLGIPAGAAYAAAHARYRELVRQNHPDQLAHMAPDIRKFAEDKLREINVSWDELRKLKGW